MLGRFGGAASFCGARLGNIQTNAFFGVTTHRISHSTPVERCAASHDVTCAETACETIVAIFVTGHQYSSATALMRTIHVLGDKICTKKANRCLARLGSVRDDLRHEQFRQPILRTSLMMPNACPAQVESNSRETFSTRRETRIAQNLIAQTQSTLEQPL